MHSRHRGAVNRGLRRRQVELLEAIAEEVGADIDAKEQCLKCGEFFKQVSSHEPHCDGPE